MNNQKVIDVIINMLSAEDNTTKRDFTTLKGKNAFLYAKLLTAPEENYYALGFRFSNKQKPSVQDVEDFLSEGSFNGEFFVKEIEQKDSIYLNNDLYQIAVQELPELDYKKGSYQELLDAKTLQTEHNLESLLSAVEEYSRLDRYELSEMNNLSLDNVVIETIYQKVDNAYKWGEITGRILFNNEVIGHYNRGGRYLTTYEYYTHDLKKWKEMLSYIIENLNIVKNDFENLNVFSKDDDIYKFANLEGRDKE